MNKVIMQFNFMKSLEEYFGGVNMADRYSDIRKNLSDKINKKGYSQIERILLCCRTARVLFHIFE